MGCVNCLEVFSKNVSVDANSSVPFNNTAIAKGGDVEQVGPSTFQFNKCGLYKLELSANAIADEVGLISLQVVKNAVPQPNALYSNSATTTEVTRNLAGSTAIQVPNNNCGCPCVAPTTVEIQNVGVGATFDIDVIVTRIS